MKLILFFVFIFSKQVYGEQCEHHLFRIEESVGCHLSIAGGYDLQTCDDSIGYLINTETQVSAVMIPYGNSVWQMNLNYAAPHAEDAVSQVLQIDLRFGTYSFEERQGEKVQSCRGSIDD